jgi:hypothetical protein
LPPSHVCQVVEQENKPFLVEGKGRPAVAFIWLLISVPQEVVFAASPIAEEGESFPATASNEKTIFGSFKQAVGRSARSFSHIVMRFNECKTRGDAIAKVCATPVCRVEIDVGSIYCRREGRVRELGKLDIEADGQNETEDLFDLNGKWTADVVECVIGRPQNLRFDTADRNLPIHYESVPPKKWMKTLWQPKASTTSRNDASR